MSSVIVWFRRDLRLANNPALEHALRSGRSVIPIYIENTSGMTDWAPGAASRWWCHQSLRQLGSSLESQGLRLRFFQGHPETVIPGLVRETGADMICWNNLYEPDEIKLEEILLKRLTGVEIQCFDSNVLFRPGSLLNNQEQPYRVFTPFWKKARAELELTGINVTGYRKTKPVRCLTDRLADECELDELGLLDTHPWHEKLHQYWTPGEAAAQKRLKYFIRQNLEDYDTDRDIPAIDGTSKLSPYLHFGEITPAQIIYELQKHDFANAAQKHVERFITEVGWREFSHHVLWHFPHTAKRAMNEKFSEFWPRRADRKLLTAWQTGNTGIPIVDAGMRELWETGWMHNRVRMIVGSLLTKNFGIHWLNGARWFWDTLVDADLANNTLGWQWVAGCGVDAAPYYRIFNPDTQARRFDPDLTYIRHWVPEVDDFSYMSPVLDLKQSRDEALARYRNL